MKKLFLVTLTLLSILGCAKGGSDSTTTQTQTNTMNTQDCVNNPSLCNGGYYNNQYGFQPYNNGGTYFGNNGYYGTGSTQYYFNNTSAGLCNCPAGTMPTYNAYAGMGCVNSNLMSGGASGYAYFGYGSGTTNNSQWMNIPQVSNYVGYSSQTCYNGVVQSCLTDQQNMCSSGYTCRAASASSRMGLCVANSSNSSGQVFR